MTERRRAGRVELAVRRDVKALGDITSRETLGELATVLARAIDTQATAAPSTVAKLVQELRAVMAALGEVKDGGNDDEAFAADMSTPVRDATQPGTRDARPEGGRDRAPVG